MSLARAAKTKDAKEQLAELLAAWRESRHPRIADLIDRLDAKLLESTKRITGKSVPARAQALIEAAKTRDPLELGRVLVSEWPKEWQAALPVLQAVCGAPDDPRVAKKLAALIDAAPYQSRGASGFWWTTFKRLNELGDVRQLPTLEAQLTRSKSRYYREDSHEREVDAVKHHRALEPAALSKSDLRLLEELEAPFAAARSVEKTRGRSGDALLAAVWANPTDLGVRAVYGDWLVEHADPRGELISLQLGAPSEKSTRRIRTLLDANWKKWLGPLADWFKVPPLVEAGFPTSGIVAQPSSRDGRERLEPLLDRPEWSTFRHLAMPWDVVAPHEVVQRFKALTSLANLEPKYVTALAKTKPRLTALTFSFAKESDTLPRGTWDTFTQLERITTSPLPLGAVLSGFGSRALPHLELRLDGGWIEAPLDAWWPKLDAAPIETIELHCYETCVRVTRARPGAPFTRVHAVRPERLERLLLVFPPGMTHLTREPGPTLRAPKSALEHLEKQLARYTRLEVRDLPFALEPPLALVYVSGAAYSDELVPRLWSLARERLGVTFDEAQLGYSGSARPLGDHPVAALQKLARSRRDSWLRLRTRGTEVEFHFSRVELNASLPLEDPAPFFDAVLALLELGGGETVSLGVSRYKRTEFNVSTFKKKRAEVMNVLADITRSAR